MHKMCKKIVSTTVIVVALALAIIVSIWHQQGLTFIIFVSRFFDVMLPVLAVGALLKYLICSNCGCDCCHEHEHEHCKKN